MHISRCVAAILSSGVITVCGGWATAADYPTRPIRVITTAAGGGGDFVARLIAQGISAPLGQSVVVDNRTSNAIGGIVAKAAADGYTLLICPDSLWTTPLLEKLPYDAVKDFAPISMVTRAPTILVVHPSVAATSVKELIALAKARPGELNYASGSGAGSPLLAAELFKAMAGVNIMRINYKGSGPGLNALVAGQVQVMFPNAAAGIPHVKLGKVRALAVGTAQPSALVPGLPTIAASGLPGYESSSTNSVLAPAGTPKARIIRLNQEVVRYVQTPDVKERVLVYGLETVGTTPEQLSATIKSEITRLGKMLRDAGIRME